MTLRERLRQLALALPSQAAVTLTKADLLALVADEADPVPVARDLRVEEVADETGRAPSTVRGWLIAGHLRGYKMNGRDWRVPRDALTEYLKVQLQGAERTPDHSAGEIDVDIADWRRHRDPKVSKD